MSTTDARAVVEGLTADELRRPHVDKAAVEQALGEHVESYGEARRALRCDDPIEARRCTGPLRMRRAYMADSSVRLASLLDAAWDMVVRPPLAPFARGGSIHYRTLIKEEIPDRFAELIRQLELGGVSEFDHPGPPDADVSDATRPGLVKAFVAGLFQFQVMSTTVVCVARPASWISNGAFHRDDGPAIGWPSGRHYHFWRGTLVDDWVIEHPERITAEMILRPSNSESRRCLIDRFGIERFVRAAGARLIGEDRYGKLWRVALADRSAQPYVVVEVENGTREPDGSRRRYFLRVPPTTGSAHEAVAWTFGLTAQQYAAVART